jgi:hypothetical protein
MNHMEDLPMFREVPCGWQKGLKAEISKFANASLCKEDTIRLNILVLI